MISRRRFVGVFFEGMRRTSPSLSTELGGLLGAFPALSSIASWSARNSIHAYLLGSGHRLIFDVDRFEALLGDAKRHRPTVVIASPDRQRASGADLLQQASADELVNRLSGGFVFDGRRQFNSAIIALRSPGQNDELRIGE